MRFSHRNFGTSSARSALIPTGKIRDASAYCSRVYIGLDKRYKRIEGVL